MEITIEPMNAAHVAQVAELEKLCFSTPWSERSVAVELENPLSYWLVALCDGQVVGYVGSQTVLDEADMMNLAVMPDARRQGIAGKLLDGLLSHLRQEKVRCLTLEVRASNQAAQALYEAWGFTQVGRRPNYYYSPREDGLILRKELEL